MCVVFIQCPECVVFFPDQHDIYELPTVKVENHDTCAGSGEGAGGKGGEGGGRSNEHKRPLKKLSEQKSSAMSQISGVHKLKRVDSLSSGLLPKYGVEATDIDKLTKVRHLVVDKVFLTKLLFINYCVVLQHMISGLLLIFLKCINYR